jgi:UDP-4-amino-4,6-dideoxy-N-acetyl-beta-L-altrosamine transaminase
MTHIPYGRQSISDADIAAVVEVLRSDWLTQGPAVERFEQAVAARCSAPYASAVCNATAALHLAYRALDLGPGDRLWTSPNTFVATVNAARFCGAEVDFVDIDPVTYNLCQDALAHKLEQAQRTGRLPKVVAPVHFAGQPCEMRAIAALAQRYGFRVVEDASHAIGGAYAGEPVGSCRYSDAAVFSFHPVKLITTGEGGMLLTRSERLHRRVQLLRSHGITRERAQMRNEPEGAWYYEQLDLGYNYRMTDIQAALGYSQLQRLDDFVARRHRLAERYDAALRDLPLRLPARPADSRSALHLYVLHVPAESVPSRGELFATLRGHGVGVNVHYIPVHLQPYYRGLGFQPGDFPLAERYYAGAISLPLYPDLQEAQQDRVIEIIRECFGAPARRTGGAKAKHV